MNTSIHPIIRKDLLNFSAYRSKANREQIAKIWLNANESSYPHEFKFNIELNRYPPRRPESLLNTLARHYEILPENLLLSRGSDEAIDLLIRLCCEPNQDKIIICPPTFHMYEIYAKLQCASIIKEPLIVGKHFSLPTASILKHQSDSVKIIFICSPNNPTGHLSSIAEIETLCIAFQNKALIVVDEAYIEFAETSSLLEALPRLPNLVILRTLSKAFGLAGIRCGITIAATSIIEWLQKISAPYALPTPSIFAAETLLAEKKWVEHCIEKTIYLRDRLTVLLQQSPFVQKVWPSHGNFLLIKTHDVKMFMQICLQNGIIIRDYSEELFLEHCVRITIGTEAEMIVLLKALECDATTL